MFCLLSLARTFRSYQHNNPLTIEFFLAPFNSARWKRSSIQTSQPQTLSHPPPQLRPPPTAPPSSSVADVHPSQASSSRACLNCPFTVQPSIAPTRASHHHRRRAHHQLRRAHHLRCRRASRRANRASMSSSNPKSSQRMSSTTTAVSPSASTPLTEPPPFDAT